MSPSTRQSRSGVSTPTSGYSVLSVSNVESISSSRRSSRTASTSTTVSRAPPMHQDFSHTDSLIELWTPDRAFLVHELKLNKFSVFAERIQKARRRMRSPTDIRHGSPNVNIVVSQPGEDIRNMLLVIYASVAHSHIMPPFDVDILTSALKVASKYKYPALRRYAINELEKNHDLPAIRRIQLSDTVSIPEWEIAAFAELCRRHEPISTDEAEILGIHRFIDISRIREEEQISGYYPAYRSGSWNSRITKSRWDRASRKVYGRG
ncbi:unnamed protein product [Rhizoctonia solani]|uniref:BTB domain-containing protein n=1 Tax=Rhizoctonia solani TaxID=456999 RepID=A0A8H2XN01_9AGAM|nr:unnamed protein product [Rhizoctonia solani]